MLGLLSLFASEAAAVILTPTISSVAVPASGTYRSGDVLTFTVNLSAAVTVTGTPRLALAFGPTLVYASYTPTGSTSTALKFAYTVQVGDVAGAGIIVSSPLDLNGGTISANAGGTAANPYFTQPAGDSVVIDGVRPTIIASPGSRSIGIGGSSKTTLTVAASGNGLSYQWRKGGENVAGATSATYAIDPVKVSDAGSYDCVVTNANGNATSSAGVLTILPNPIVYSGNVAVGASGATAHFSIEGSSNKTLVIAAYGPATATSGAIADPQISIVDSTGATVASNDNWGTISDGTFATTYARLGLTALTSNSKDAVVYRSFAPGSYKVLVTGVGGVTGSAVVTIADADLNPPSRLAYVAIRGPVASGAPLSGGFTLSNSATKKMLVRSIGPSLGAGGNTDPNLTIYDSNGTTVVASNDNWGGGTTLKDAFAQAGAFSLADNSRDDAILGAQRIGTGTYTVQARSATSGDVLLEIYDLDGSNNATFSPTIVAAPTNVTASAGPVSFTVGASGGGTLTYSWKRGSTPITGATGATLTLNSVTVADAGSYTVTVTSSGGSATASATLKVIPAVSSSLTASATYGTAFTYTIAAANSPTGYNATGLPTGLSVDTATGAITGSPTQTGSFSVTLSASNADGTGTATLALEVGKKALTVAGVTAGSRVYDGTVSAALGTSGASLVGVVGTDDVTLNSSAASGTFANRHVGSGKAITATGFALGGTAAGNYTLTQPTGLTGEVTAKALAVSGVTAVTTRVYDRTTVAGLGGTASFLSAQAAGAGTTSDGKPYTGDTIAIGGTPVGAFATKAVGAAKAITVSGITVTGTDAGNYTVTQPTGLVAEVTAAGLTVSGVTASNKVYDGTVTAPLNSGTAALVGVLPGDSVSLSGTASGAFASRHAGTAKAVAVAGLSITGTDSANYTLTQPAGLTANVTAKALTIVGVTASDKIYNATTVAPLGGTAAFLAAEAAGAGTTSDGKPYSVDTISVGGTAAGAFADKDVATGKAITVTGLTVAGTDAANYAVTQPTGLTAAVTKKTLTVSGVTAGNKIYDGTTAATLSGTPTLQTAQAPGAGTTADGKPYTGDTFSASGTLTGTFADKDAATGKTVAVAGVTLTGPQAGNYDVAALTATADITPKELTISGLAAVATRTYDGTAVAGLTGTPAFAVTEAPGAGTTSDGIPYSVDNVTVGGTAAGAFANRHAGTAKSITVTGLTVTGTGAANYRATQPTGLTADITPKALNVLGLSAVATRVYDTTPVAGLLGTAAFAPAEPVGQGTTTDGQPYAVDTIAIGGTAAGAFASKTVGTAKAITVSGVTVTGTDAGNYTVTQPTGLVAEVTSASLTVSGVTANHKTYDGNAVATLNTGTATLVGVLSGDSVSLSGTATGTFASKTVGTGKAVQVGALALTGTDAGNYSLNQPATTANITAKTVTVAGATAGNKVYDASAAATADFTAASLVGVVGGDTVSLVTSGATATFASKTVGTAKAVAFSGLTLSGADAANYALTQPATTANITAKTLTVTGVTASSKTYDANGAASLSFGGAALVGVVPGDTVSLATGGATGAFTDPNAGINKSVQISGLSVTGADAGNYSLTQPSATATIFPASVAIAITGLTHTYDGSPKSAVVTSSPPVGVTVTYSGSGGAPTTAGSYTVTATVSGGNFSGAGSATLVIAKAPQTVTFGLTGSSFTVGSTLGLNATATSGLPVTFSVVSGGATIAGSTATVTEAGAATLRATQAGNENYLAASAEQGFTGVSATKTAQTISFASLPDVTGNVGAIGLSATATSGLPVSFTVLSGPAVVAGRQVVLTGATGVVVVRASQAGNETFAAAPDVVRAFVVTQALPDIFFGDLTDDAGIAGDARGELMQSTGPRLDAKSGDVAAILYSGTRRGSVLITSLSLGLNVALNFTLNDDGTYTVPFTGAGRSLTLSGSLSNGVLTGRIPALRVSFSTKVLEKTGQTAGIAGFYDTDALNTAQGGTASIVGPNGQLLIVASTGGVSTGALGTVGADGKFNVSAPGATITGAVDAPSTTISGTIVTPGQPAVNFAGIAATSGRTDRLINLSSRVRVGPESGRTLITGFVIGGTEDKRVLLRAAGPGLTAFGVQGALTNPRLRLYDGAGKLILENDDWSGADTSTASAQVGAFSLVAGSKDAAVVTTLKPGAYTMHVIDGGETGVALAEIYDASANPQGEYQRLVNISARGEAGAGENVLIGGFIVTGNVPKKVLIRGIGPGLAAFGVTGTLADPRLRVYDAKGLVAENDNWSAVAATATEIKDASARTGGFALTAGSKDSAIILTLNPGSYTAQVDAVDGSSGVALVEVYELPQ